MVILSLSYSVVSFSKNRRYEGCELNSYINIFIPDISMIKEVKKINKYGKNTIIMETAVSDKERNMLMCFKQSIIGYVLNSFAVSKIKKAIYVIFFNKTSRYNLDDKYGSNDE